MGLGTHAVEGAGNDYPLLVAWSHLLLHPEPSTKEIRCYSQRYIDVIDLEDNQFKTITKDTILQQERDSIYCFLKQVDLGDYIITIHGLGWKKIPKNLLITFDKLLQHSTFVDLMTKILSTLEKYYHPPLDIEFIAHISNSAVTHPNVLISLLKCHQINHSLRLYSHIPEEVGK